MDIEAKLKQLDEQIEALESDLIEMLYKMPNKESQLYDIPDFIYDDSTETANSIGIVNYTATVITDLYSIPFEELGTDTKLQIVAEVYKNYKETIDFPIASYKAHKNKNKC